MHAKSGDGSGAQGFSDPSQKSLMKKRRPRRTDAKRAMERLARGLDERTIGGSMVGRRRGRSVLFSNRRNFGGLLGSCQPTKGNGAVLAC